MSHQDRTSDIIINHQTIKQVVDWLFPTAVLAGMKARSDAKWKPRMVAVAALLWATSGRGNLTDRFEQARKIVAKVFRWQAAPGATYQGFMKTLRKWHIDLMSALVPHLRTQMGKVLSRQWKIAGYVVFAVDGSRIELARTESLEEAFSSQRKEKGKKKGNKKGRRRRAKAAARRKRVKKQAAVAAYKKANSPQMWLTLLWHVGTGLPWAWRTGPSDSSERGHFEEMLTEMPENSLATADAGFVGYEFWSRVLNAGHHFVIRLGANVRLIRKLGYTRQHEQTVYLWTDKAAKKKQPPLVLRLIVIHDGKHPMYLLTDLSKSQLSDRQAATIYRARWGIEVFFRTFKQTFGCRKLRSRSAANAKLELDWCLLGLWCMCLLGQRELEKNGADPTRLSAAATIKTFQDTLHDYRVRPESREESLWAKLRLALLDDYQRKSSKTSRNYPRKKQRQRIGAPKISPATKQQIIAAKELRAKRPKLRLPA
jgi:DDE family transposase